MLTYITEEPTDETDTKRCFKYPFVAAEILSNNFDIVVNLFTKESDFMERFMNFLRTDHLNLTLAGYFAKVYISLYNRYCHFALSVVLDEPHYWKDMVRHISSRSIAEVVERLLSFEEAGTKTYVKERKDLLDSLIDFIAPETEIESNNACSIIVNFLNKQASVIRWDEVASHLATTATLERLLRHLYCSKAVVVKSLVTVLIAIINYAPLRVETPASEDDAPIIEDYPILDILHAHLEKIVAAIKEPRNALSDTTFKAAIQVLGEDRLKLCELLAAMLNLNDSSLHKQMIQEKVPELFVGMFVEYTWNSGYHKVFEAFVNAIFDSNNPALKEALIVQAELPRHLVELSDNEKFQTGGVEIRRGNLGFVTRISNTLVNHSKNESVKQLVSKFPSWDCYVCEALRERNEIENRTIAGQKPNIFSLDQSDEEEEPKVLSKYDPRDEDPENLSK